MSYYIGRGLFITIVLFYSYGKAVCPSPYDVYDVYDVLHYDNKLKDISTKFSCHSAAVPIV